VVSKEDPCIDDVIHVPESLYNSYVTIKLIEDEWKKNNRKLAYRAKWLYQQFLKLLAGRVIIDLSDSFVIVDADTVFLRDIEFYHDLFLYSKAEEYHKPYLSPIKKLLNTNETIGFSCIIHHMIMQKETLDQMITEIENNIGYPFVLSVLNNINYNEASCFSEWDLYANYIISKSPERCRIRQLKWKDIPYIPNLQQMKLLKQSYDFVSCHAYMRGIE